MTSSNKTIFISSNASQPGIKTEVFSLGNHW